MKSSREALRRAPRPRLLLLTVITVTVGLVLAGCGPDGSGKSAPTTSSGLPAQRDPNQKYTAATTVLVADKESVNGTTWAEATVVGTFDGSTFALTEPPRPIGERPTGERPDFSPACSKPEGDPTAGRNTFRAPEHPDLVAVWVSADQKTFNVLVRPGAADAVRQQIRTSFSGPLCIAERDLPTQASLRALQDRIFDESKGSPLGGVFAAHAEERRGVVVVECALADDVSRAWAAEKWGDKVDLVGALTPID